ncbi:hypothetical protein MRB53_041095 [Persea americana]|nr:hypothetical protein MRB53_041095 [Persea americana]
MPHDAALATLGDDFMTPAESEDAQTGQTATVNGTSEFVNVVEAGQVAYGAYLYDCPGCPSGKGPPTATQPTTLQSLVPALGLARLKRHLASGDMKKFWQTWNSFPRRMMSRPVEHYWIYEMEHEKDPVTVENGGVELAMSLFKAIKYVDPLAEIKEWNDVRGKCEKVLRAALQFNDGDNKAHRALPQLGASTRKTFSLIAKLTRLHFVYPVASVALQTPATRWA